VNELLACLLDAAEDKKDSESCRYIGLWDLASVMVAISLLWLIAGTRGIG